MSTPSWPYPGSRWWKFDFHAHTPESADTPWARHSGSGEQLTPRSWLLRFMAAEVDCVAVTDHNTGAWVDPLKQAYAALEHERPEGFRPLVLFPGVEIAVNGGFHLLAIFDPEESTSTIDSLLGEVRYRGTRGDPDGVTEVGAADVVRAVLNSGGIPIPAHVDRDKGLLRVQAPGAARTTLDANTVRQVLEVPELLAIEIVERAFTLPTVYSESGRRLARILGSDCHSFRTGSSVLPGERFTWVKMASATAEGLRLALLDGDGISIRRSDDGDGFTPDGVPEHFVESVEIDQFQYMGRGEPSRVRFSPLFNALIGGRGSGKSTIVHAMRLALRREAELKALPVTSLPRRTFDGFSKVSPSRDAEGGLTRDSAVTLTFRRDGVRYRLHWREDGSGTVVEEERSGAWVAASSQSVDPARFPVRIFSQGQIAALCDDGARALLDVIDEAAGVSLQKVALDEARTRYLSLRAQIRALESRLKAGEAVTVQWEDVERKLKRFEQAGHGPILKAFQVSRRQQAELDRQYARARELAASLQRLAQQFEPEVVPPGTFDDVRDREPIEAIAGLAGVIAQAQASLQAQVTAIESAIESARSGLASGEWRTRIADAEAAYTALQEELAQQGIESPSQFGHLVQEKQRLDRERAAHEDAARQCQTLEKEAQAAYDAVLSARQDITRQRHEFLARSLASNQHVRISVHAWRQDPAAVEESLREILGVSGDKYRGDIYERDASSGKGSGVIAQIVDGDVDTEQDDSANRLARIEQQKEKLLAGCAGENVFGAWFNRHLGELAKSRPEVADRIRCWFPEDGLRVEYSRDASGQSFLSIEQASAGQRAAAMLAFLLAQGREPLVLDQPEDDLDNHLIYDLVVRQIRESKLHRQIVIVTHNPNVVVNGDAEMIHALGFRAGQCRVTEAGALQDKAVRDEVCRVMEGGRDALDRRYQRLGREI